MLGHEELLKFLNELSSILAKDSQKKIEQTLHKELPDLPEENTRKLEDVSKRKNERLPKE